MTWDVYVKAIASLVFVLGLIAGAAYLARRFGAAGGGLLGRGKRRLSLVETLPLDSRRRLLLVRRDDTEHLLLIGGAGDVVVETGLAAPPGFAGQLKQTESGPI